MSGEKYSGEPTFRLDGEEMIIVIIYFHSQSGSKPLDCTVKVQCVA